MDKLKESYPTVDEYVRKLEANPKLFGGYRIRGSNSNNSGLPLVSVVTVTFNAEKTLKKTLDSVRAQTYKNIEHIIVDGGSTDGTLGLVQANENSIAYWRSERDHGVYDAFNKGVVLAQGEYVGILNADDYYETDQIENAVAMLTKTGAPFVHGDIIMHGWRGTDVLLRGDSDYASKISYGMPSLHQVTVLCRSSVFKACGLFHTHYLIAGDYEWFLRLAKQGVIGVHSPSVRAHMLAGGVSTTRQRRAMFEAGLISWRHGLPMIQAARLTLPRVAYPNGRQQLIADIKAHIGKSQNPVSRLARFAVRNLKNLRHRKNRRLDKCSLIDAFLAARQECSTISPLGLEWLYGLSLRSRTHSIKVEFPCTEVSAIRILLHAGGSKYIPRPKNSDVLLLDAKYLNTLDIDNEIRRRTILVIDSPLVSEGMKNIPHLNFGALLAFGIHIDPRFSTRQKPLWYRL